MAVSAQFLETSLKPNHPYNYFPSNGQLVDGKLYVFPIESAFKYSHQLNRKESS